MTDPKTYGLNSRTVLKVIGDSHLAIVIARKSRIIMKDGKNIIDKIEKIKQSNPQLKVSVITTAPVCGKTKNYLDESGIKIMQEKPMAQAVSSQKPI